MSDYLFGIEEDEGLSTENVSASWNCSKVDILLTQYGFINLWDKTEGERKSYTLGYKERVYTLGWKVLTLVRPQLDTVPLCFRRGGFLVSGSAEL